MLLHTNIHKLMPVAAIQCADQHIRSSTLPKDTLTFRPRKSNQRPSDNQTLALPLSHSRRQCVDVSFSTIFSPCLVLALL